MAGVNIAHLLVEAKNLASKLQEDDKSTDQLINNAQTVSEKISCLKEYKECLNDLHECRSNQRPRSVLVHNLQQENRQIKILQDENRQLKMALEEHQVAIDLIMKRYRQQVTELIQLNQCQQNAFQVADFLKDQNFYSEMSSLSKFASLFDQCMKFGEEASFKDQQELVRLKAENQLLRRLLKIASEHYPPGSKKIENLDEKSENSSKIAPDDNEDLLKNCEIATLEGEKAEIQNPKLDESKQQNATEIPVAKSFLSKMTAPIKARSVGKRVSLPCTSDSKSSTLVRKSPSSTTAAAVAADDESVASRQRSAPPTPPPSTTNQKRRSTTTTAPPSFVSPSSPSSATTIRQSKSASFYNNNNKISTNNRKSSSSIR